MPRLIFLSAVLLTTGCIDTSETYDVQEAKDEMEAVTDTYFD